MQALTILISRNEQLAACFPRKEREDEMAHPLLWGFPHKPTESLQELATMPPKRATQKKGRASGTRAAGGDPDDVRAPVEDVDVKEPAAGSDSDAAAKDEDKRA